MNIVITKEKPDTPDAIALYCGCGFKEITHFGEYKEDPLSLFF